MRYVLNVSGDVVIEPEIEVFDGLTEVNDGGTINFGSTAPNVGVDKQVTVRQRWNRQSHTLAAESWRSTYRLFTSIQPWQHKPGTRGINNIYTPITIGERGDVRWRDCHWQQ